MQKSKTNSKKKKRLNRPASSNPKKSHNQPFGASQKPNEFGNDQMFIRSAYNDQDHDLKKTVSTLKGVNSKLKYKISQREKDLIEKDREIRLLIEQRNDAISRCMKESNKSNPVIQGFRKRIEDYKEEIISLRQKIDLLKKSNKLTAINELRAEIKVYNNECSRLRKIIERFSQGNFNIDTEETERLKRRIKDQEGSFKKLKTENDELIKRAKKLKEEAVQCQAKADEAKRNTELANNEVKTLREDIKELGKAEKKYKLEMENFKKDQNNYDSKIEAIKNDYIKQIEELKKADNKYKEQTENSKKTNDNYKMEIEELKKVNDKYKEENEELKKADVKSKEIIEKLNKSERGAGTILLFPPDSVKIGRAHV